MKEIEVNNKKIFRPDSGKKLKLKSSEILYDEIVLSKDSKLVVEEVEDNADNV